MSLRLETASLTFANYSPMTDGLEGIYRIGATGQHPQGVAREIATAFDHDLAPTPNVDNLGELIGKVGPAKELRDNIAMVQAKLETSRDGIEVARGWAERSELLTGVERMYATAEQAWGAIDLAIVTGGVRNWMYRRGEALGALSAVPSIGSALLVGGNRQMKLSEGPDVEEGMTEADYLDSVIAPRLGEFGIRSEVLRVDSGFGDNVMEAAARKAHELVALDGDSHITIASNAGAWPQNAGQFRRAARGVYPAFDERGNQLEAIADEFPLGTGEEPAATHQHPLSAVGQIVRNLQEFTRQVA